VVPPITACRLDIHICHTPETMAAPMAISMTPPVMLMARMCRFSHATAPVTQLKPRAISKKRDTQADAISGGQNHRSGNVPHTQGQGIDGDQCGSNARSPPQSKNHPE